MSENRQFQKNTNIFYKIFTLFFLFFMVNCYGVDETNPDIKYGYPDQSIFVATINGEEQPITPMLLVAEELFKRANLTWSATAYPAKRLFKNLKNGETDFSILVRASSLLDSCIFSKKPVYSTNLNIYYIGERRSDISIEDLIGSRVATIRGYSYGKLLNFIDDPKNNISKELTNTHSSAFRMLKLGRVDYLIDYASAATDIISENSISNIQLNTISKLDIFLVISKSFPNASVLMQKLETIVETMDINNIVKRNSINAIGN